MWSIRSGNFVNIIFDSYQNKINASIITRRDLFHLTNYLPEYCFFSLNSQSKICDIWNRMLLYLLLFISLNKQNNRKNRKNKMLERKDTDFRTNTRVQFLFKFRKKLYDCNKTIHIQYTRIFKRNLSGIPIYLPLTFFWPNQIKTFNQPRNPLQNTNSINFTVPLFVPPWKSRIKSF